MEIRPFAGWRYSTGADRDVSAFLAPPYDVLSAEDKQGLLARCETNIVAVDLPHVPPADAGPRETYESAADLWRQWQGSGLLAREEQDAIYACEQTFSWGGRSFTRLSMICGVRAAEPGRDVIPHEHTFAGPKADRLRLTECMRAQLSPIFGFYDDPSGIVAELLGSRTKERPDAYGQLGEVTEKLWAITDREVIGAVAAALRDEPAFIADGHHRYATGVAYRDALRAERGIDDDHPANYVMFALVAKDDPGLLVLPTHRIVRNLRTGFSVSKLARAADEFSWQRCSVDDSGLCDSGGLLGRYGPNAMAFLDADPAEIWIASLRDESAMATAAPDEPPAWRQLSVAILHKLIIDKALNPWRTAELSIDYTPDSRQVRAACESGRAQLGVCMQATPLEAVETLARAGASMPHKSTYFYPKLATGMVVKPLA